MQNFSFKFVWKEGTPDRNTKNSFSKAVASLKDHIRITDFISVTRYNAFRRQNILPMSHLQQLIRLRLLRSPTLEPGLSHNSNRGQSNPFWEYPVRWRRVRKMLWLCRVVLLCEEWIIYQTLPDHLTIQTLLPSWPKWVKLADHLSMPATKVQESGGFSYQPKKTVSDFTD